MTGPLGFIEDAVDDATLASVTVARDQLELRIQQDAAVLKWLIINRDRNEHLHTLDTTFGNSDVR